VRTDELFKVLEGVQAQIRFFDTKAQIVLAVDGILAGFLGTQAATIASKVGSTWPSFLAAGLALFFSVYLGTLALSLFWAFRTVYPRLDVSQPESKLFFAHIAHRYRMDYERAAKEMPAMPEQELLADLAKQTLANSQICTQKQGCLSRAIRWLGVSMVCWVGTLVFLFGAGATKP
jgi:disulfide bond formation protein DsbB